MVGSLIYPALFALAAPPGRNIADFTNHGAPAATVGPSATDVLVLDVTISDAWKGLGGTADILMQAAAGGVQYWQYEPLSAIPILGIINGFGFKDVTADGAYQGSAGSEPVVMDEDGDSVYTSAADTLVDADGVVTNTPGVTALSAGDALFDIGAADLVVSDSLVTPTKVWKDYDNNAKYTGAETAGTTVAAEGDAGAEPETLVNAMVTATDVDGIWDVGEGVFVSADTTYDVADTIVMGTPLQTVLLAKVSGGNDVWAGDATEGVWDDISAPTNYVNTGDTHITTETLTPLSGAAETAMALTNTNGIAVGDTIALTTTAVVSGLVATVTTNGITFAATAYNGDPANILAAASINSHGALVTPNTLDTDVQSTGSQVLTFTSSDGQAVGDAVSITCSVGGPATGTITAISGPDVTINLAVACTTVGAPSVLSVTAPGAVTGELTVPITALTNAKVTGANGAYAAGEGVYVSTDTTLSAGDTIVRGETLEALTDATVTVIGAGNNVWDTNEDVYNDLDSNGTVTAGDVRLTDITAEPVVLGTPVDADAGTNVAATAGWVKEINATWTPGDDLLIENVAGELTYSASADTDVYTTGGLVAGDALIAFPADCDGVGAGTQACGYTGGVFLDSTQAIYIDEGSIGGAAPNSVVDRQDDRLTGIGVQNTGTAVNLTDITLVEVWADAGAAGFQGAGTDTNLGAMTVNSLDTKEWRLGGLTQAVAATVGQRIFVTVDISGGPPTDDATLIFQIPVYNDAGLDGVATADDDVGVFTASAVDGPKDGAVLNGFTQTIDSAGPIVTSRVTTDADGDGQIDRIIFTTDEALDDDFAGLTVVTSYAGETYATGSVANDNIFWVNFTESGAADTNALPNTQITVNAGLGDAYGNDIAVDGVAVAATDGAKPAITSITTADTTLDGTVDQLTVAFSETVDIVDTGLATDGFTAFDGLTDSCTISNQDLTSNSVSSKAITVSGCTAGDTSILVELAYNATDGDPGILDEAVAPNEMADGETIATGIDGAKPAITSITTDDTVVDGTVDQLTVAFSETVDIVDTGLATDGFTAFDGLTDSCAISNQDLTSNSVSSKAITVSGCTAGDTSILVELAYNLTDGDPGILDEALTPNEMADGETIATGTDGAAPAVISATFYDADAAPNDGKLDLITVVWSENISAVADDDANWALTSAANFAGIAEGVVECNSGSAGTNECDYNFTTTTVKTSVGDLSLAYDATALSITDSVNTAASKTITSASSPAFTDAANPVVASTSPADGATGVALDATFSITFSEAMTMTDITTTTLGRSPTFTLGSVNGTWSAGNTVVTFAAHDAWAGMQIYTINLVQGSITSAVGGLTLDNTAIVADPYTFTTVAGGGGGGGGGGLPASMTVTAPNGGEALTGGGTYNLTWSATGVSDTVNLYYSLDSGINFPNVIALAQTNDGSYTWTVPNITSGTVKVKAVAGSLNDISDSNFSIAYATPTVSTANSTIVASPTSVVANGTSFATITVTAKDAGSVPLSGEVVALTSSRGSSDTITTLTGTTGADGKATFNVYSSTAGTSTYTATVAGTVLSGTATVVFTAVGEPTTPGETPTALNVGDLIKSPLSSSVYYYGSDNKRHLFPNEKTYRSWYTDFSGIKIVTASQLQGISLGHNVTVRPGTVLLKIETDPKVYAVEPGGLLRWVPTEARAATLYGSAWATRIIDVPLVFWVDYSFGSDITTDAHPTGSLIQYTGTTDKYYIQGSERRLISTAGFTGNNFQLSNVLSVPTTLSYTLGSPLTAAETALVRIY